MYVYIYVCVCVSVRVCLCFMAYQLFLVILCQIYFYTNKQFYFKQFSLTIVHRLTITFLLQAISFSQTALIQTIQFSISIISVFTELNVKTVLFQTIQFSVGNVPCFKQFYLYKPKNHAKTVPFQAVQFCISAQFISLCPIERTQSGAKTTAQSGPRSNGHGGVLRIPQSSSITEASSSDCLVLYTGHSLGNLILLQRSSRCITTAPANWASVCARACVCACVCVCALSGNP